MSRTEIGGAIRHIRDFVADIRSTRPTTSYDPDQALRYVKFYADSIIDAIDYQTSAMAHTVEPEPRDATAPPSLRDALHDCLNALDLAGLYHGPNDIIAAARTKGRRALRAHQAAEASDRAACAATSELSTVHVGMKFEEPQNLADHGDLTSGEGLPFATEGATAEEKPSAVITTHILPGGTDQDPRFAMVMHSIPSGEPVYEEDWKDFAARCGAVAIQFTSQPLRVE